MKIASLLLGGALAAAAVASAAEKLTVTVTRDDAAARAGEAIVVPWTEVGPHLTGLVFDQVDVRDASGAVIPSQVTAFHHVHKGPQVYDELIFQHDFAAGEKSATFTVEKRSHPRAPFPARVAARYVPERYDDFAWENDRMAHRAYGPALELPSATKDQMTSSGIDFWSKRVDYLVVDGWYHKGHDGLHTDTGEGLDMYDVGTYRGLGGTGIWDGQELHVSRDYHAWKIYANGPIHADFELDYEPWDAGNVWDSGNGVMVSEAKRVTVEAGRNLDGFASTFAFKPARGSDGLLTVAIGLTKHSKKAKVSVSRDETTHRISLWEEFKDPVDGSLGTAVLLDPSAKFTGFAETPNDVLILVKVSAGEPVRYLAGGGWDKAGEFKTAADWESYLNAFAARLRAPVHVTVAEAP
ncbi:MAG TPA: DUF4861 family protein [Candidatus Didemnitutus sp.]|nr:DUF4861 family protein [Candidatus Didemnitutus sp.]